MGGVYQGAVASPTPIPVATASKADIAMAKLLALTSQTKSEMDAMYIKMKPTEDMMNLKKNSIRTEEEIRQQRITDNDGVESLQVKALISEDIVINNSLIAQYDALKVTYDKMAAPYIIKRDLYTQLLLMKYVVQDAQNGFYVSVENRIYLESLGIYLN